MKNFKKILSLILAITMVVTMFSINTLFSSADVLNNDVIEEIEVDLKDSQIVRNSNNGNVVFKLLEKDPLRADFWPCWDSLSGTKSYSEALMDLRSGNTPIRFTEGYKYAINVKYTVVKATSKPQIGIVYNIDNNLNVVNDGSHVLKAATHTATGSYMLSVVADGVEDRPLRIAFGGQGQIVIESVKITRVATENLGLVKTVNLVDRNLTTKAFVVDTLETPVFEGAKETIFGGWYTDAEFTTAAGTPVEDGTYYAKWASVVRMADLNNSNHAVYWSNTDNNSVYAEDKNVMNVTSAGDNVITVAVNKSSSLSYSTNTTAKYDPYTQLTLEYKDLDTEIKDNYYGDYIFLDPAKQYAITVDFDVVSYTSTAKIAIATYESSISGGTETNGTIEGANSRTIAGNNQITSTGSYTISGTTNATGLVDYTYGTGGPLTNYNLRLVFAGVATFVIKSVTIQEVYKSDVDAGKAFGVTGKANGVNYKVAAYNDNGTWKLPEPVVYGEVTDKVFGGWYTDANCTIPVTTPVQNSTYYAKWLSVTRELDLKNLNRMSGSNNGENNGVLKLTNATDTTPMTVTVNSSTVTNYWADSSSPNHFADQKQHISLEYYDFEPNKVQDGFYGGYVLVQSGKNYSYRVKYKATAINTKAQIFLVGNQTNLSYNATTPIINGKEVYSTGAGELNGVFSVGHGGAAANHKVRLAFAGNGTFEIESITIQEVLASDISSGTTCDININENGTVFRYYAVNNGTWVMPKVNHGYKGNVIDAKFAGWYSDASFATPLVTPVARTTYYPKFTPVTRELDLVNVNRMANYNEGQDTTVLNVSNATDSKPLTVTVNGKNADSVSQQITMEYYDDETNLVQDSKYDGYVSLASGKLYLVDIKYNVTNVGTTAPTIAVLNSSKSLSWASGQNLLISATNSQNGEYSMSGIVGAGIGGAVANDKLRLVFNGQGTFEIKSITVTELIPSSDYIPVVYKSESSCVAQFATANSELITPDAVEGKIFLGWYDANGQKITSVSQLSTGYTINTLTAKWIEDKTEKAIDLSITQVLKSTAASDGSTIMNITPEDDGSLNVDLNSTWNNIFMDTSGNIKSGALYPDAILALKLGTSTDPTHFVKLQKDYKYIVNVEYEVTEVNSNYNPQIAIVKNNAQNSAQDNGSVVLNTATHAATGEYTMSAVMSNIDNVPLRLAFGGVGNIVIKSVTLTTIHKEDTRFFDLTYNNSGSTTSLFAQPDTQIVVPEKEGYAFLGWYDANGTKYESLNGVSSSLKLTAKWVPDKEIKNIDLTISQIIRDTANSGEKVMGITPDTENNDLAITLNSNWNNIFMDQSGNIKSGALYPDAIVALKLGTSTSDPAHFVKLQKDYKYIVNVEYEVTQVGTNSAIQVAIVKNNAQNSAQNNGSVVLNTATHAATGKYTMSAVMSNIDNVPLRLAFGGVGKLVIKSVELIIVYKDDTRYFDVNYKDNGNSYSDYQKANDELFIPSKEGYYFDGWYTTGGTKVEDLKNLAGSLTLNAKWYLDSTVYDIDLTISQALKYTATNGGSTVMTLTPDAANNDLDITLNSNWNNIFIDADGNVRTGVLWPDALLALKLGTGTDPSDFMKLQKDYRYSVNVEYEVLEVSDYSAPQIAIVKNNATNSAGINGSVVLNTVTHNETGKYVLSALMSNIDNVPLRLAFGGVGKIKITSVKVQLERANDDRIVVVTMADTEGVYTQLTKIGTDLPVVSSTAFTNFGGWYSGGQKITTVSSDVNVTAKWYGKHDITMNDETNICDLVALNEGYVAQSINVIYDVNRDGNIDNADFVAIKQYLLGIIAIGDNSLANFAVVKGAQKTLLTTLAAETFVSEVKTAFDIDLEIKDDASKKVVIGIENIPEDVLDDQAINTLTGIKGDEYGVNDFKVFVYNGNIYVEAGSDYATAVATNALVNYLKSNYAFATDFEIAGTCTRASEMFDGYSYKFGDEFNQDTFNTNRWYFTTDEVQGTNYSRDSDYYLNSDKSLHNANSSDDFGGPWIDPEDNPNMQDGKIYYGENYTLDNGALVLNTKRIENGYSAAKINAKQSFTYGIMTARVKLATQNGATSAVWARTVDDNGAIVNEMDFFENYGAEKQVVPNLHTWRNYSDDTNHFNELDYKKVINYGEETFHEIALVWTSEKITFYFDGEVYLEQDITDIEKWEAFHKSSYMIFDVSVPSNYYADSAPEGVRSGKPGDILGGLINSFNENMSIDYVRVFQQ